jgi:Peptide-N-glycosidase F, C terminal/Secretion system C-terminal sorting domain
MLQKIFLLLICLQINSLFASAGDTLHVRSHNETHLNWYGDFYQRAKFPSPDISIKKIKMKLTLGCPTNGCSDWDYTVKIFARRQIGVDTANKPVYEYIEFARYITPYSGDKNFGFYRDFEVDITDFRSVLTDSAEIGVKYEGYSDGFTISLDYYFVKGTPIREAYKVVPVYYGGFPYGDPANSIENYIKPFEFQTDSAAEEVGIQILQTGHGFGGNEDCAEFCPKYNFVKVNGVQRYSNLVWKDDCGKNPLLAQPGTWLYDRANWCPGEMVRPYYHDLTAYVNLDTINVFDLDMTPFTNNGNNSCSYNIASNLIYYKNRIADNDIILEDILAPSKKWAYARFNPICTKPKIKVRNDGKNTINGVKVYYGYKNIPNQYEYTWNGVLAPYTSTEIELESMELNQTNDFEAYVISIDSNIINFDDTNNYMTSKFDLVKILPPRFAIEFRANSVPQENYYEILDAAGNVIHMKDSFKANTMHRDTISFTPGCYTFILHDLDKDGLSFFANTDGLGSIRFRNMAGTYFQSFNANFGTEVRYQFIIDPTQVGIQSNDAESTIKLYPNPASDKVYIENNGNEQLKQVKISTISGQIIHIYENMAGNEDNGFLLPKLADGLYIFEIETNTRVYQEKVQINQR